MPIQTPTIQSLLVENAELRARLEKLLRDHELSRRLRAIYDGTREYMGLLTPEGILLEANRASLAFAGSKLEDVVGLPFWKTVWFQFTPGAPEAIQGAIKAAAGGDFVQFVAPIITPAGETKMYDLSFYPIRDDSGKVIFIVPEGLDITGRKQGEAALRQAHQKLQTVLDSIADGLAVLDKNWCFTYMNEQGARIIGLIPDQFIGRSVWELFPHAEGTKLYEFFHRAVATGQSLQFEEFYPEPLNLWVECRCYPSTEGLSVYFHDVTARKKAEVLLRQNEGLFSALVEQAPTGEYVVDAQFRLQQINARAMSAFVKVEPLIGRNFAEVMNILWGTEVGGQLCAIFRHTLTTGEPYLAPRFSEFREDIYEDKSYDWQTQRVTLPDGQHGVVCYFNDITEKIHSEQALLEAKAAAESANRSKDQFLAALSHELRTPLTPVLIAA